MDAAYQLAVKHGLGKPCCVLGDMNVDRKDANRLSNFHHHLVQFHSDLVKWKDVGSGQATQSKGGELDWALCAPGFNPIVQTVDVGGAPHVSFDKLDDDDEWNEEDAEVEKDSDHVPITVTW